MRQLLFIVCLLAVWAVDSCSQQKDFPILKGAYLGQKVPGNTPEMFAPGVVSTASYEFSCSFSPNGNEFYFTRRDPTLNENVIMATKLHEGIWTKPEIAPFVESQSSFEPMVTPDGKRLYFSSGKTILGQAGPPKNILFVEREGDGWSMPKNPGPPFNPAQTMYISSTTNGTIYTTDISAGPGKECLAVLHKIDGEYSKPERLGSPINGEVQRLYPFIAPDENYLVFASRVPTKGFESGLFVSELLVAFRGPDGSWSKPQPINLGMDAGAPYVTPDGKYLFFTSGHRGKSDIYWVSAKVIEDLRLKNKK